MAYTVRKLEVKDLKNALILRFIADSGDRLNRVYGDKYEWSHRFPLKYTVENHLFLMCFKGDEPVGLMVGTIQPAIFDINRTVLRQETLFGKYPKATIELLRYFIDFGKVNANLILTNIGEHTNLKPASLEKLGFTKLETLYSMEA